MWHILLELTLLGKYSISKPLNLKLFQKNILKIYIRKLVIDTRYNLIELWNTIILWSFYFHCKMLWKYKKRIYISTLKVITVKLFRFGTRKKELKTNMYIVSVMLCHAVMFLNHFNDSLSPFKGEINVEWLLVKQTAVSCLYNVPLNFISCHYSPFLKLRKC